MDRANGFSLSPSNPFTYCSNSFETDGRMLKFIGIRGIGNVVFVIGFTQCQSRLFILLWHKHFLSWRCNIIPWWRPTLSFVHLLSAVFGQRPNGGQVWLGKRPRGRQGVDRNRQGVDRDRQGIDRDRQGMDGANLVISTIYLYPCLIHTNNFALKWTI